MESKDRVNVLLVDDQPGKLMSYQVMLGELDENLVPVSSANEALAYLLKSDVAVVLVDVCMPELDGFELAKIIRDHPRFQKTAIIFISAIHMTESDYLRGYEAGAVDYLSVPVVPELLRAKVRVFAELYRKSRDLQALNQQLEQRVSERTQELESAAAHLRRSERHRSLALAAGNMGTWAFEVESGTLSCDEGQSRIMGLPRDPELSPDRARSLIHAGDMPALQKAAAELSPEKPDCHVEVRIVRPSGEVRWCTASTVATFDEEGQATHFNGVTTDITELKKSQERQTLLAREVDHRAKNALAVVQSIVRLARRGNMDDYANAIEGRISALAQTHELLSQARWRGADVRTLIQKEMAPYERAESGARVRMNGPSVTVAPETAQGIAMAIHELATNAAKYGSLSQETGRVEIGWSHGRGILTVNWRESGGPAVTVPKVLGFGTKIIGSLKGPDRGDVQFDWQPDGLRFTMKLTCKALADEEVSEPSQLQPEENGEAALAAPPSRDGNVRVLLVEDELIVGIFMQETLAGLGYEVSEPLDRLEDAVACARTQQFDLAVLDMNLHGVPVYPLADILRAQRVPFLFLTGYSPDVIEPRFRGVPVLQKPVGQEALENALAQLRRMGAAASVGS